MRCLLTNVTYAGKMEHGGEIFSGEHEAIVNAETFAKVGELLKEARREPGASRNKHGFLLRGLLRCASCESAMVGWSSSGKRKRIYRYYTCSKVNQRGTGECPVRSVSADKIETFVVERVRQIGRDPARVQDTIEAVLASRAGDEPVLHSEKIRLEHQLAALRGEAKQLVANLREAKSDGSRAILERLSEAELRTGQIERRLAEIAEASTAIRAKPITREEITRALRDFDPAWKGLVPREQASLLALLIESVVYDGAQGEVAITWRPSGIATLAEDVANAGGSNEAGHGRGKGGRGGRDEGYEGQDPEESAA